MPATAEVREGPHAQQGVLTTDWTAEQWARVDGRRVDLIADGYPLARNAVAEHCRPGSGPTMKVTFVPSADEQSFSPASCLWVPEVTAVRLVFRDGPAPA